MRILTSLLSAALVTLAGVAHAQENFQGLETIGKPEPKGMGFQFPATELMRDLVWLDNFLLVIITVMLTNKKLSSQTRSRINSVAGN